MHQPTNSRLALDILDRLLDTELATVRMFHYTGASTNQGPPQQFILCFAVSKIDFAVRLGLLL